MIYVLLTYLFSPLLYLLIALRKRRSPSPTPLPQGDGVRGRVLVIQTAKIGDMICSTPVFREIKKKYPDIHLTVMLSYITKELIEKNPNIDEVIPVKNLDYKGFSGKIRLSNLIRDGKYDVAVCLNPNIPFAIALFWGLVPVRLSIMPDFSGPTFRLASMFYTSLEKHIHGRMVIETYMQMLRRIGIESNDMSKEIYKSEGADQKAQQILGYIDKPLIGITVSSGNKLKEFGTERIAKVINTLSDNFDVYVVLIGSEEDKKVSGIILDLVNKKDRVIDTIGKLKLNALPALIEKLSLFIGVDSGITYMADALSVPLIDIAGPSDMCDQRPLGKNSKIIQRDIPCVPCSHAFRAPYSCERDDRICITSVSVAEIVEAVNRLLKASFP